MIISMNLLDFLTAFFLSMSTPSASTLAENSDQMVKGKQISVLVMEPAGIICQPGAI